MKKENSISRRDFVKTSVAGTTYIAGASLLNGCETTNTSPNVLFIITDQQHIDTISAGGCSHVETPAMDRLYRRSVSFQKSYSTNPVSSPARSSMLTGRTTCETGVYRNGRSIIEGMPHLGEWIRKHTNYDTKYIGKWHIPETYQAEISGFDVLYTGTTGVGYYADSQKARICEGYLRNHPKDKPFFLVTSFMEPHDVCEWLRINRYPQEDLQFDLSNEDMPIIPENFEYDRREPELVARRRERCEPSRENWDERQYQYYRWSYYRQIEFVDGEIGRVLDALDESGLTDNTLIIFTSDHGEGLGHHRNVRKNMPYDESARVPFLISLPGQIEQNTLNSKNLVSGLDIVPTICDYMNIPAPPNMRGISLKSMLEGEDLKRPYIVTELENNQGRMIRSNNFKYIKYINDPNEMLFDMEQDPGETQNLAFEDHHEKTLNQHRKWLSEWEASLITAPDVDHSEYWNTGIA